MVNVCDNGEISNQVKRRGHKLHNSLHKKLFCGSLAHLVYAVTHILQCIQGCASYKKVCTLFCAKHSGIRIDSSIHHYIKVLACSFRPLSYYMDLRKNISN